MGPRGRQKRKSGSNHREVEPAAAPRTAQAGVSPSEKSTDDILSLRRPAEWFRSKGPVFRFVALFAAIMLPFSAYFFGFFAQGAAFQEYLALNARLAAGALTLLGSDVVADGAAINSPTVSLQIRHGCDAIFPSALFVAAVLASPVSFRSRLPGLFIGTVVLLAINIIRIATLYWAKLAFGRAWFHWLHVDIWQPAFVFLALLFWVIWALRATGTWRGDA